ncbi:MAG: peptidoglycan editing factor PgeF [Armatimonadota bacterium]|nr:peptidoglycan editing factor PgeF [Armatimonadota bacterium]MDR7534515.1 peptidoglycan editing factor PgeF [Armatimonadota bacterium]MDR7536027.1 peptidoglycan editing factor PgeF [Armatimonadota bacterium]
MTPPLPDLPTGWSWTSRDGLVLLRADVLAAAGVCHAFTTRPGGASRPPFDALNLSRGVGDDDAVVRANRAKVLAALGRDLADHVEVAQVHGRDVVVATAPDRGRTAGRADGLTSAEPRAVLAVHCADCVPVLLWDRRRGAAAAVHAGWRGVAAGVVPAAVATMCAAFGTRPEHVVAAIGPAIGPCCYEVDGPVVERFAPWSWRGAVFSPRRPGRWSLDLWEATRRQLHDAGLAPEAVVVAGMCTAHHPALFFSHRRDGRTGHMAALIAPRG